jgi:hypothetical protein
MKLKVLEILEIDVLLISTEFCSTDHCCDQHHRQFRKELEERAVHGGKGGKLNEGHQATAGLKKSFS